MAPLKMAVNEAQVNRPTRANEISANGLELTIDTIKAIQQRPLQIIKTVLGRMRFMIGLIIILPSACNAQNNATTNADTDGNANCKNVPLDHSDSCKPT